jgi:hypothetical protein
MWLSSRRNIYDTAGGFSHLRERDYYLWLEAVLLCVGKAFY